MLRGEYPQIWVCARCMPNFQAGLDKAGCGITKYSSSHSFNPLLLSKSAVNLSIQKVGDVTSLPSLELEHPPLVYICPNFIPLLYFVQCTKPVFRRERLCVLKDISFRIHPLQTERIFKGTTFAEETVPKYG